MVHGGPCPPRNCPNPPLLLSHLRVVCGGVVRLWHLVARRSANLSQQELEEAALSTHLGDGVGGGWEVGWGCGVGLWGGVGGYMLVHVGTCGYPSWDIPPSWLTGNFAQLHLGDRSNKAGELSKNHREIYLPIVTGT